MNPEPYFNKDSTNPTLYKPSNFQSQASKIFSPTTGISDSKDLNRFLYSLRTQLSTDEKLNNLTVLINLPAFMIDKFANSKGLKTLLNFLNKSLTHLYEGITVDIVDKILSIFKKLTISQDLMFFPELMKTIIDLKDKDDLPEILNKKVFFLTMKWKKEIEEFTKNPRLTTHSDQETPNKDQNPGFDDSINRKRTNPKYLENEVEERKEKLFDKNLEKKDKNKKKVKYDRKKESHHHRKPREKEIEQKNSSNGKFQKKKDYFKRAKSVNWNMEDQLLSVKFFKKSDEPNATGLSTEEVDYIQKKIMQDYIENSNPFLSSDEIKHKESLMEGRSMKLKKESEKELQEKLNSMKEKIPWCKPKRMALGESILTRGEESKEKAKHSQRISTKLSCFYSKEISIPDEPSQDNILNKPCKTKEIKQIFLNETEADAEIFGNMIIETIEIIRKEEESKEKSLSKAPSRGILKKTALHGSSPPETKDTSKLTSLEKAKEIDPKTLQKLLNLIENKDQSLNVKDELDKFIKELRSSGQNIQNILENIKLLKIFMTQQQTSQMRSRAKVLQLQDQRSFIRKSSFKPRLDFKYNPFFKKQNSGPVQPVQSQNNILMSLFPTNPPSVFKPKMQATVNNNNSNSNNPNINNSNNNKNIINMSNIPNMGNIANMNNIANIPSINNIPNMSTIPNIPNMSNMSNISNMNNMSNMNSMNNISNMNSINSMKGISNSHNNNNNPNPYQNIHEELNKPQNKINPVIEKQENNNMLLEPMAQKLIPTMPMNYPNLSPEHGKKPGGFHPNQRSPHSFPNQNNPYPYSAPYKKQHNSFDFYPNPNQNNQFYRSNPYEQTQEQISNPNDMEIKKQGGFGKNQLGGYRPQNYKTVPCRFFHSTIGCPRGEECHFIHDYNYMGVETPNMHKYVRPLNQLSHNQERNQRNMMLYGTENPNRNGEMDEENEQKYG